MLVGRASPGLAFVVLVAVLLSACTAPAVSSTPSASSPVAVTSSGPAPTPIPGCLPACVVGALNRPGALEAGDYQTRHFFGGLFTVTVPSGYTGHEDSTGELAFQTSHNLSAILDFWLDVYPIVDPTGTAVAGVEMTADGVLSWIQDNPNVAVISREPAAIGALAGESLDIGRSPDAVNVDPECPSELAPCVGLVGFPQWEGIFGEGGPFHIRFVAADATWGGENHVVWAMIDAPSEAAFAQVEPEFMCVIESAQVPPGVTQ
jgi:hypothetical protein